MSTNHPVKLTVLMLVALLLLSYGVGSIHCATAIGNSTDMLSLLNFKQAINDPTGALNSWNRSTPHCQWQGIRCNPKNHGRVTALSLAAQSLSGSIPVSVGNLTFLHTLDLSINNFFGQMPHFNNLQKMQILNLSYNSLDSIIPDTLTNCSSLMKLHLNHNDLRGEIPREIGLLTNLVFLALNNNNLTGVIPQSLGNITYLTQIFLSANQLGGNIPDELGQFSNILVLGLADNRLSGSVPASLFNLSSLAQLDLGRNQLNKTLPTYMGDRLSNLQKLYMGHNMLEGNIPDSLGNATNLQGIVLQSNKFTGHIPTSLGKLSMLSTLDLQVNMLEAKDSKSWGFLHALGNCSALQVLAISLNQLQGVIPNSIGKLPASLQILILGGNKLSGIVPPIIGNLSELIQLTLDENSLTGDIGQWVGALKNLQSLYLQENNFTGSIPSSIGDLSKLTYLYLQRNSFGSTIPQNIGKLHVLLDLDLSYNNIQGSIPLEVANLKQLVNISLSSNKLIGDIPGTLAQCESLARIKMDENLFTGNIPVTFGNLTNLITLNLSNNDLSGTIPRNLGDLPQLTELDLLHNHLQGEIPTNGIFRNSTAVSLDDNWGLCGGVKDLRTRSCASASREINKQYYLVRILIPIFGFLSLLLLVYFLYLVKKVPRRNFLQSSSFGKYFLKVSYNDLAQATKSFSESNLIGRGSYSSVYKGKLKDQKIEVAVKVFDLEMRGAERSFIAECEALRSIQHRNLLPIITACLTIDNTCKDFKALLYEYMPNGNLDTWLHHKGDGKDSKRLGLTQRINIAVNIADALDYLHHDCGRPTIHCDLKPSNILLDEDMNALLADFGIARFYVDSPLTAASISSIGVKGTIGYIAPEYAQGGHASISRDVYSFGIVLLEMLTGKRPTDPTFNDGLDLVKFVADNFPHQIHNVIDDHHKEECREFVQANTVAENVVNQCLASLLQVALSCAHPLPNERLNMKVAASKIQAIKDSCHGWQSKK